MVDDAQGEGRRIIKAVVCANLITSATCSRFSICALETACWWLQTEGLEQQQVEDLGPATAGKVGDGERDRQKKRNLRSNIFFCIAELVGSVLFF